MQPEILVYVYAIVYGPPTPATAGSNVLPLIPVPLNTPPAGVPVNVTAPALLQIVVGRPVKLTSGNGFTITVAAGETTEHPFTSATVSVYESVVVGVMLVELLFVPTGLPAAFFQV